MGTHPYDEAIDFKTVHADLVTMKELKREKRLLIENVRWRPDKPNRKGRYLKEIYQMIKDYPRVGICYDVAHGYINREPMEEIIKYKDRIQHFHITDTRGREDLHLPIGQGELKWSRFFEILAEIDYRGFLIIEK